MYRLECVDSPGKNSMQKPGQNSVQFNKPEGITDDIWRKSVAFVGIHGPILPKLAH